MPPKLPSGWPTSRTRFSYSRTQDARSEASVKDKIAMFSNDRAISTDRLDKCGTLPTRNVSTSNRQSTTYMDNYDEVKSLDRRLTKSQDNLDEVPKIYKRHTERPETLGGLENSNGLSNGAINKTSRSRISETSKPLFYASTTTLPSAIEPSYVTPVYHTRSISDDSTKNTHKSNLEYLIEQRKKSMSKLRGLMLSEVQSPIVDLPEIKFQNGAESSFILESNNKKIQTKEKKKNTTKPIEIKDCWKSNLLPNNLPKYSPAFKRKSLQLYTPSPLSSDSIPETRLNEAKNSTVLLSNIRKAIPSKPPRQSLDPKVLSDKIPSNTLPLYFSTTIPSKLNNKSVFYDARNCNNMDVKICTITDVVDSDNDSAMSSTQSSYRSSASSPLHNLDSIESDSSRLSPRICHYTSYMAIKSDISNKSPLLTKTSEQYEKRNVSRSLSSDTNVSLSSSAGSAATSGSQASCSSLESSVADTEKRRVSKVYDIDTINRKNILASAKCRNGRDAKVNSPVVETKFVHESYEISSAPQQTTLDRLSTLTSTVSAISNKGESRRRNKVIAESDSDSDNEVNIRQRKSDYKNTRLKRNSSANNKNKLNDICTDTAKANEEAPQVISERIIKEIQKAGLDNYQAKKTKPMEEVIHKTENSTAANITQNGKVHVHLKTSDLNGLEKNNSIDNAVNNKKNIIKKNEIPKPRSENIVIENKISTYTVNLKKGVGTGVGLILAGGIDCEAKDVTVSIYFKFQC